jgi:excisionase family DNA binding protein
MAEALASAAGQAPPTLALRPRDAARALSISERTLWALQKAGEIPVVRIGRSTRYDVRDLLAYLDAHKGPRT